MKYSEILKELYSIESAKIKLGLSNIKKLLRALGNPEKKCKYIHVAGTNGKGSVCALLHSILCQKYKVGMYTSPHLKKFNERIRVNNTLISDKDIVRLYRKVKKYVTTQSFFEITTAMAFLYFAEKKVDIVVLETGLGGRLDATNVIVPLVSVITSVGKEHTNILGNKIEGIAFEKASIIKNKIPAVTGATGTALQVIKDFAKGKNAPLSIINERINPIKKEVKNKTENFQSINVAIALQVIDILIGKYDFAISQKIITTGLKKAKWPGRMQRKGNVLIDCAHNDQAFELLFDEIERLKYNKLIVVCGFSNDKNVLKISKMINERADIIVLTQANNQRAAKVEDIQKYFSMPILIKNSKKAVTYAKKISTKKDLILIAGSIYLIGEII